MSITSDLRGFALACDRQTKKTLLMAADRIDAEHEKAVNAFERDMGMEPMTYENMAEHGWVRLPLDADGAPIHVGDVVTMQLLFGGESKPLVVDRMELSHGRDGDLWCVALDTDKECWNQPSLMRHYTPPTVEDVLTELEGMRGNGKTYEDVVMRCADLAGILRELLAGEDA